MNNELKIRTLLERFFDGETTLAEEQLLYDYFRQEPDTLPEDLRPLRPMFLDLQAVGVAAVPSVAMSSQPAAKSRRWLVAAALAAVVAGGALLLFSHSSQSASQGDEELVAFVYGERTTDHDVVLSEMQRTMAVFDTDEITGVEEQLKSMFAN